MGKTIFQNVKFNVPTDDTTYDSTNTDILKNLKFVRRAHKIIGFAIFSKQLEQVDLRGTFKMDISGNEVFPDNTDSKMFTVNASVPVEGKFFKFKEPYPVGNYELNIEYTSTNNILTAFVAHDVTFCFMIEQKDND